MMMSVSGAGESDPNPSGDSPTDASEDAARVEDVPPLYTEAGDAATAADAATSTPDPEPAPEPPSTPPPPQWQVVAQPPPGYWHRPGPIMPERRRLVRDAEGRIDRTRIMSGDAIAVGVWIGLGLGFALMFVMFAAIGDPPRGGAWACLIIGQIVGFSVVAVVRKARGAERDVKLTEYEEHLAYRRARRQEEANALPPPPGYLEWLYAQQAAAATPVASVTPIEPIESSVDADEGEVCDASSDASDASGVPAGDEETTTATEAPPVPTRLAGTAEPLGGPHGAARRAAMIETTNDTPLRLVLSMAAVTVVGGGMVALMLWLFRIDFGLGDELGEVEIDLIRLVVGFAVALLFALTLRFVVTQSRVHRYRKSLEKLEQLREWRATVGDRPHGPHSVNPDWESLWHARRGLTPPVRRTRWPAPPWPPPGTQPPPPGPPQPPQGASDSDRDTTSEPSQTEP